MVIDHALATTIVLLTPLWSGWSWRRLVRGVAAGRDDARLTAYAETIAAEWSLAAALLVAWIALDRSLESLGLAITTEPRFLVTALVVAGVSTMLLAQVRAVRGLAGDPATALRRQLESVRQILPHSAGERSVFLALALTAGVCEELLYRGFLIGYLTPFTGTAGAVAGSAVVFGIIHGYQGRAGVLKTGTIGLVMGLIYVASGSIWPAIVLHVVLDVQGGLVGYAVLGQAPVSGIRVPETASPPDVPGRGIPDR